MRVPKIRDLTEEQKRVYLYAPTDKNVLVHGPPGTGKTLIACLRAIELQKKHLPVVLGMFSRVLAKYSSNAGEGREMPTKTVIGWFLDWWHSSGLPPHPSTARHILLNVPFAEKDLAKGAGARWHPQEWRPREWNPHARKPGVWVVDCEHYAAHHEVFQRWQFRHEPPHVEGNANCIDWAAVTEHVVDHEECIPDGSFDLGMLLIDEGQDFPEGFYKLLRQLSVIGLARNVANPLRCFVLADENQQITESNSTLEEIAGALKIEPEHRYLLLDNFRNSREIAELARSFFSDVGVLPRLPERTSAKPSLALVGTKKDVVDRIKMWVNNNPRKEVGVLTFNEPTRAAFFDLLGTVLKGSRGRNIVVQTYSWGSRAEHPADELLFDTPDVVSVINMQSCKGLEFDAVFIVDLHEAAIGYYGVDRFKMQMFVAVSRAREWVTLVDSGGKAAAAKYFELLPSEDVLEREQRDGMRSGSKEVSLPEAGVRDAAAEPARVITNKTENWETSFSKLARQRGLRCEDLRTKNGALWVVGGPEIADILEPLGFSFSTKRGAWWRK